MQIVIFEDDRVAQLAPISATRPAFTIGCGGINLYELVREWQLPIATLTRPYLARVTSELCVGSTNWESCVRPAAVGRPGQPPMFARAARSGSDYLVLDPPVGASASTASPVVAINGRIVPSRSVVAQLANWLRHGEAGSLWQDDVLVAALLDAEAIWQTYETLKGLARQGASETPALSLPLLEFPHDVIRHHEQCLQENLEYLVNNGQYQEVADDVFAAPGAALGQFIVSDTTRGPIVLEKDSVVEPYAYLCGPIYLGCSAKIKARAHLTGGVSVGTASRIGGEAQTCMMEAYSNKQHDGFLGHSYVGSWVNLGASTCVSNLKNSYGEITVQYQGRRIATGMRFLGAILGDYVKTAIQTCIFSGKRIGTATNLYGLVTEDVGSFVNYARQFGDVTEVDIESVLIGQQRMMERRSVVPTDAQRQLLRDLFAITQPERPGLDCRPPKFTFPVAGLAPELGS